MEINEVIEFIGDLKKVKALEFNFSVIGYKYEKIIKKLELHKYQCLISDIKSMVSTLGHFVIFSVTIECKKVLKPKIYRELKYLFKKADSVTAHYKYPCNIKI